MEDKLKKDLYSELDCDDYDYYLVFDESSGKIKVKNKDGSFDYNKHELLLKELGEDGLQKQWALQISTVIAKGVGRMLTKAKLSIYDQKNGESRHQPAVINVVVPPIIAGEK